MLNSITIKDKMKGTPERLKYYSTFSPSLSNDLLIISNTLWIYAYAYVHPYEIIIMYIAWLLFVVPVFADTLSQQFPYCLLLLLLLLLISPLHHFCC